MLHLERDAWGIWLHSSGKHSASTPPPPTTVNVPCMSPCAYTPPRGAVIIYIATGFAVPLLSRDSGYQFWCGDLYVRVREFCMCGNGDIGIFARDVFCADMVCTIFADARTGYTYVCARDSLCWERVHFLFYRVTTAKSRMPHKRGGKTPREKSRGMHCLYSDYYCREASSTINTTSRFSEDLVQLQDQHPPPPKSIAAE